MITLSLTCKDHKEADQIAKALLEKKLVICTKQLETSSRYWWQAKIRSAKEVLLLMEAKDEMFDKINKVVGKLHSYDQYVLLAYETLYVSDGVEEWADENSQ